MSSEATMSLEEDADQAYRKMAECPMPPEKKTVEVDEFREKLAAMWEWLDANQPDEDETVDPDYTPNPTK